MSAVAALPLRNRTGRVSLAPGILLTLALPAVLYSVAYAAFRQLGAPMLAVVVGCSMFATLFSGTGRIFASFVPFYVFSLLVLSLSLFGLMPEAWPRYMGSFVAIRQWAWLPVLTIATAAFYCLVRRYWPLIWQNALLLAFIMFVVSRGARMAAGSTLDLDKDVLIYTLTNDNAFIFGCIAIYILYSAKTFARSLAAGIFLIAVCSSASSSIAAVLVLGVLLTRWRKTLLGATAASLLAFVFVASAFVTDMYRLDYNTGFRALLWRDAQEAVIETKGLGVGYGTMYIRNDFRSMGSDSFRTIHDDRPEQLPYVGTHTSLYDVAMRVGLFGLLVLLGCFYSLLRGFGSGERLSRLYWGMIAILLVNNAVNMGLASINFTFGTALVLAIALVARDLSRTRTGRGQRRTSARPSERRIDGAVLAALPVSGPRG